MAAAAVMAATTPAWSATISELVSLSNSGVQGKSGAYRPSISADGRYVAFESSGSNLVARDTNAAADVFVRDRRARTTLRVSVGPGAAQGNSDSFNPAISADGRFIAFQSLASNLVSGDTNSAYDIFVRDRQAGTTRRVSVGPGGVEGNGDSFDPAISANGRFVAFVSSASNLVAGDPIFFREVLVHDRQTGVTSRVGLGPRGIKGNDHSLDPSISADGRFVAFMSFANNLVPGDTNETYDIFVRDRKAGTTRRVSVGQGGVQANADSMHPSISSTGRFVAFESAATNLVPGDSNGTYDVFVRDLESDKTKRISIGPGGAQGNRSSVAPVISGNGRFIAFLSYATNLVPGDTNDRLDVFMRDSQTNKTSRASLGPGGAQANGDSTEPAISRDGRVLAYHSSASNLVPGDLNNLTDVFARYSTP